MKKLLGWYRRLKVKLFPTLEQNRQRKILRILNGWSKGEIALEATTNQYQIMMILKLLDVPDELRKRIFGWSLLTKDAEKELELLHKDIDKYKGEKKIKKVSDVEQHYAKKNKE